MNRDLREGVGHGKLLLFGEHAAVYGRPACGLTLPTLMRVRIEDNTTGDWELAGQSEENRKILAAFLRETASQFPRAGLRPGRIRVESNIPQGVGFGSSAAWCVAFTRAVLGGERPVDELWGIAHRSERFFHGTPSGIDTGLAILGGLFSFEPAPPALPRARRLPGIRMQLLVGAVPRSGSTRELIGALRRRIEAGERKPIGLIEELGSLSAAAIELLSEGDAGGTREGAPLRELARLANEAQDRLARLGLSTPGLDEVISAGLEQGALGGKLSGAGGGGVFYLLFDDALTASRALAALKERFSQTHLLTLTHHSWPPQDLAENRRRARTPPGLMSLAGRPSN